jgi:hypothetical protein
MNPSSSIPLRHHVNLMVDFHLKRVVEVFVLGIYFWRFQVLLWKLGGEEAKSDGNLRHIGRVEPKTVTVESLWLRRFWLRSLGQLTG